MGLLYEVICRTNTRKTKPLEGTVSLPAKKAVQAEAAGGNPNVGINTNGAEEGKRHAVSDGNDAKE
jgi:hypothetical protein